MSKGFTLIELMVAVIIMIVALLALAQSRIASDRMAIGASHSRNATALAQDLFEWLREIPFDQIASGSDNPLPGVTRTWTIIPDPHDPQNLVEVQLVVQWRQFGKLRSANFTTHIARH